MPAPSWLRFGGREENTDETQGEFNPAKFQETLMAANKTELDALKTEINSKFESVNAVAEYIKEQKAEKERTLAVKNNERTREESEVDDELWITNPAEAHRRSTLGLSQQSQAVAAITMRREVLGDKEYYTGDFKDKVDAMIEQQPLHLRASAQVLNNCYKVILADHMQDVLDGKLKKQAAYTNFSGTNNGKTAAEEKADSEQLTNEEKLIASKFGFSDKEWISSKKELSYV